MMARLACVSSLLGALVACGAGAQQPTGAAPAPTTSTAPTSHAPADAGASHAIVAVDPPAPQALYARFQSDFWSCYEKGKRSAPAMGAGRVTWLLSVDEGGKVECVVPVNDTGFTQEVEDCMSERIFREPFEPGGEWAGELPVRVREGAMQLGEPSHSNELETLEWHGLADDDASNIVKEILPTLQQCVQPVVRSSMQIIRIGGQVAADGHVTCALASSSQRVPHEVRQCAIDTLSHARFRQPKNGRGLVSIPLKLTR